MPHKPQNSIMLSIIQKIIILAEARIPELMKNGDSGYSEFYKGSETFVR